MLKKLQKKIVKKMENIRIRKHSLNLSSFKKEEKPINIEKSYTEGVYSDTPTNRKLGRVGMSYKVYNQKIKQSKDQLDKHEEAKNSRLDNFIVNKSKIISSSNEEEINKIIDGFGFDIDKSKGLSSKKKELVKNIREISKLKGTVKEIASDIDEIIEEGREGGFESIARIDSIYYKTTTLKNLNEDQTNAVIDYSGFNINKEWSLEQKKKTLAEKYIKSAELEGNTHKEIADDLDSIIEDALDDYVPKKD